MTVTQLKVRLPTRFPSSVVATSPITLDNSNGSFTFGLDVDAVSGSLEADFQPISYTTVGSITRTVEDKIADIISAGDFGILGDNSTANDTAIADAITYCLANNKTLAFVDGIYRHTNTINWAYNRLKVMALGDNVVFLHTGTGIAHSFSGIANYPASQGCIGGVFGGPGRIMLKGNSAGGTTRVINLDNWHFGYMKVALRDGATCLYGRDTGIVGSSAVETTFDVRISNNTDGAFSVQPGKGIDFSAPVACIFDKLIVEGCGASASRAVVFTGAINNLFNGGTIESNDNGGISLDATSTRNTFLNLGVEANGSATDWAIAGAYNSFINCQGAGTVSGNTCSGNGNVFIGGQWQSMNNTGSGNTFQSNKFVTAFTDGGLQTTILNPDSIATAAENATSILGNKTINTDNSVTLKIASNTVNAVTGTGATVVLATSPTLVTPNIGAATGTSLAATGALTSSGTAGIGYATGAGGTVTQSTNKSTGVTLNKICGRITMNNASLASLSQVAFTLTNSTIAATDVVMVCISGGVATGGSYGVGVDSISAGSCRIALNNGTAGALAEAVVIQFVVVKAATS